MERRHYLLLLPLLLTTVIVIGASLPGSMLPHWLTYKVDKSAHSVAYGLLAASWLVALRPFISSISAVAIITILLCLASGFGLGSLQKIIPHRRTDLLDLKADMIGALTVSCCWWLVMQIRSFYKSRQ